MVWALQTVSGMAGFQFDILNKAALPLSYWHRLHSLNVQASGSRGPGYTLIYETYLVREWERVVCGAAGCVLQQALGPFYWVSNCLVRRRLPLNLMTWFIITKVSLPSLFSALALPAVVIPVKSYQTHQKRSGKISFPLTDYCRI